MSTEAESFFGGGGPALKFPTMGTRHVLTITDEPEVQQQTDFDSGELLWWDDEKTKPKNQMIVHGVIPADDRDGAGDDGERRLFVKSGLVKALRDAMRQARVKAPAPDGVLTVAYVKDGPKPARGYPAKVYEASYTPPAPKARATAAEFLGGDEDETPEAKPGRIAQEVASAKRNVKAKVAVATAADMGDDTEPPF